MREDFPDWVTLWNGYNSFYGREGSTALPAETTNATWQRFFDSDEPVHCLVAERGGRLVGLAHYVFHRITIQVEPTCYLADLFTSAMLRGEGVGRALINAVYDQARLANCTRVYWHTRDTNSVAVGLYDEVADRSGFIVYRKSL
jgi:GNAT superfamily N-acetyltransferase